MESILDALQEGRLFELPDSDKESALRFLAHVIEAFPQYPPGTDVVGAIMARENEMSTAIGRGWACPHAMAGFEEDLVCVLGWSPTGIDYGAPDGTPVSIVAMYLVPANQREHYLREVSILAKAISGSREDDSLSRARSLDDVRNHLLDLVAASKQTAGPDARARMIRLQAKAAPSAMGPVDLAGLRVEALAIVGGKGGNPIALTQNADLASLVESMPAIPERLENEGFFQAGPWRIVRKNSILYQGGRFLLDCIALAPKEAEAGGK
jgi:mannitol/fructose-specific phosphotransferase system IIA component (Ntr-type)